MHHGQDDSATNTAAVQLRDPDDAALQETDLIHVYSRDVVCKTDTRGHATPRSRGPFELMLDATEGFIPLWASDVTLRWRFQDQSMVRFKDPEAAKSYLRALLGETLLLWTAEAVPVRFTEARDAWDFEIAVNPNADCVPNGGCTLARAFFPDAGQHDILIYPTMFEQPRQEQIETMAHELGHVFGLRHFFAQISEKQWSSVLFGDHQPFTIMNYGGNSLMTDLDRADLRRLYQLAWAGTLTSINGTPIKLFKPYSASRYLPGTVTVAAAAVAL